MSWVPDRTLKRTFHAYLTRRRSKGEKVNVLKPPYKQGTHMCAVLEVDGMQMRVFFSR
jgi:hypothetical protein